MAIVRILLDPNAVAYADDEIVGKVNSASANITRENAVSSPAIDLSGKDADDLAESATKKYAGVSGADFKKSVDTLDEVIEGTVNKHLTATKDSKLAGIEDGAKDDQTGAEIRDAVLGLPDTERALVKTNPLSGEFKITAIQRDDAGELDVEYDDVPIP